jgi:hypothetical protein
MILTDPRYTLTTDDLAALTGVQPPSIRVRLCRTGSYFGLHPRKLPNGRLMWPEDSADRLYQAAKSAA